MQVKTTEVSYGSTDGASTVHALLWLPEDGAALRGIVQIVHGMAEHIGRYEPFARFLVEAGFAVCANDHVGHGKTASDASDLGHIPFHAAGKNGKRMTGKDILVEDVHALRKRVQAEFPGVPYAVFGHSMGSFVTRVYITRYGDGLRAAVLCGTGQQPRALSWFGMAATRLIAALRGARHRSPLVHSLGAGSFSKKLKGAGTELDWISPERAAVDEYRADPACGQMFSVGGYAALTALTGEAVTKKSAARVPKGLPLLFIAGAQDPVGDFGRGVRAAAARYRAAGMRTVDEIIYPGMRHEIINRPEGQCVREDVLAWLEKQGL